MSGSTGDKGVRAALRTHAVRSGDGRISGHVFDEQAPERRFVVELLLDGYPAALARADLHAPDLAREGCGDGCYGFVFSIDPMALQSARRAEIRLANSGEIVGAPLPIAALPREPGVPRGEARWNGGLRFTGWVSGDPAQAPHVSAMIDGEPVAEALATGWTHVGEGAGLRAFRRFDLRLPQRFADGCARSARILDDDGAELPGSPCAFVAFPDGLARFLDGRAELDSERLRGEFYDRLAPQSLPFAMFEEWRRRFPPPPPPQGAPPKIAVALIGAAGVEASVASLEAQQGCDWVAGALEGGAGPADFDNSLLREFLDGEAGECPVMVFVPSGAVLRPRALALLAAALEAFPSAALAYADFSLAGPDGTEWPVALPAFSYELMLEQGCGALLFAARANYVRAAAAAGAGDLFRLFFFGQDARKASGPREGASQAGAPVHQPGFLARLPRLDLDALSRRLAEAAGAHLSARGVVARTAPGAGALLPSARIAREAPGGRVSILIPARDRADRLEACFASLSRTVDLARHEVVVLDNDSVEAKTADCLARIAAKGARLLRVGGPFDVAALANKGAAAASGEFILTLGQDIEALEPGWLDEMLSHMAEPDVGAVGATLLWPSGVVRHGGVVLGPDFAAVHAFDDCAGADPGYGDLLRVAHDRSAVAAACLLTDRRLFLAAGGYDGAHFPLDFIDVDYCLKLRAQGLRVVMTPHARLLTREIVAPPPEQIGRRQRALRNLRAAWGDALLADPAYHPMLALDRPPYSGLAWPPRQAGPRQPVVAPRRPIPPGF